MPDAKSPYPSILSPTSSNLFSDFELHKPIKFKLKTAASSPSSPPKWKNIAREIEAETSLGVDATEAFGNQSPPATADYGSPVSKQLDPHDRLVYGKLPMTETPDLVPCPRCKKPFLRSAVRGHLESCSKEKNVDKKKERVNGETNGEPTPNKKKRKLDDGDSVNGETTPPKKKPSKRDKEDSETKKEKKKKPPKVTVQKLKRTQPTSPPIPVDVEKQCGVWDPEKQTMCARSLTCKSHSMSAKRAVPGRSQPYDVLLSLWQRKNQVKAAPAPKPTVVVEAEDVDSDEEVRLVMAGVARRYARPLEQRVVVGVRRKVRGMRMYEGLKGALLGGLAGGGSGVGRGRRQSQVIEGS